MACDAQTLATESTCFKCGLSQKQLLAAFAWLACQIAKQGDPTMACDAETVAAESACFKNCLSEKQLWAVIAYKLCQIEEAGGGGGAQEVFQPVPAAPTDPTKPALAYPNGGGATSQWDVPSQAWV